MDLNEFLKLVSAHRNCTSFENGMLLIFMKTFLMKAPPPYSLPSKAVVLWLRFMRENNASKMAYVAYVQVSFDIKSIYVMLI